jgi:hypothetical protein
MSQAQRAGCSEKKPGLAAGFFFKTGAGKGIRTLDFNLGKVALYH